jgi:hypothetical protein
VASAREKDVGVPISEYVFGHRWLTWVADTEAFEEFRSTAKGGHGDLNLTLFSDTKAPAGNVPEAPSNRDAFHRRTSL